MRIITTTLAVLALDATIATAQTGLGPVIDALRSQGYRAIEVEREGNRIEVEARRGGRERELVYDARTGRLISDESRARSGGAGLGALFGGNRSAVRGRDDDDDRGGRAAGGPRGGGRDDDDDDDDDGGNRGGGTRGGDRDDDDDDGGNRGGGSRGGGDRDDDDDDRGGSRGGGGGGNDSDDDDD
jgi:hypothetical protein